MDQLIDRGSFWKPTKFKIIITAVICFVFLILNLLFFSCFGNTLSTFCKITGPFTAVFFYIYSAPELLVRALLHPSDGFYESERNIHTLIKIVSTIFNPAFTIFLSYTIASFISKFKKGSAFAEPSIH